MRNNSQLIWSILLLSIVSLFLGYFYFKDGNKSILNIKSNLNKIEDVPVVGEGQEVKNISFSNKQYSNSVLGFSFEYPKEYKISSFGNYYDQNGQTILLQKEDGLSGLQVVITPFNEDTQLNISRIKKELPSLSIKNETERKIGSHDNSGVYFESTNSLSTGDSFEFWFIYNRNLYQISADIKSKSLFDRIVETWKLE